MSSIDQGHVRTQYKGASREYVLIHGERVVEPYLARFVARENRKTYCIDINSILFFVTLSYFDRSENVTVPS
jgi:hypothetical protein